MIIDLRSDTLTKPTPEMCEAMLSAPLGDDVFGEDPTINHLERKAADKFGMESALFCPSGTMTNQLAIRVHTQPGDEIICDKTSHIYLYEGGGVMMNSGASMKLIDGNRGRITSSDVLANVNPDDIHFPVSKLVSLENTCNRGGGCYYKLEDFEAIRSTCDEHELKLHLDGARLFNALIETGDDPKAYGALFDTISICLSKGLGCPVGSLMLGTKKDVKQARRYRKIMGGGMRQAGLLAAAGIYALDNHIARLKDDHNKAKDIGESLAQLDFVTSVIPVETNILVFHIDERITNEQFISACGDSNIKVVGFGPNTIRMVTHLDISSEMVVELKSRLSTLPL